MFVKDSNIENIELIIYLKKHLLNEAEAIKLLVRIIKYKGSVTFGQRTSK